MPEVGHTLRRRMLTLSCREIGESIAEVARVETLGAEAVVFGSVVWRGTGPSGDAAALDCGFPLRIQSSGDIQLERAAKRFSPRSGSEWRFVPVPLAIPPVGTVCTARGVIGVAAEYEVTEMFEDGFPDMRADWLIRAVRSCPQPELNGWMLDLHPLN